MGYYPQESLYKPYKYHGYTVRGTPNCPLIKLPASSDPFSSSRCHPGHRGIDASLATRRHLSAKCRDGATEHGEVLCLGFGWRGMTMKWDEVLK